MKEAVHLSLRMHLMLFYFEGLYYHCSKRGAGVGYVFTGRPDQQRPRYHLPPPRPPRLGVRD